MQSRFWPLIVLVVIGVGIFIASQLTNRVEPKSSSTSSVSTTVGSATDQALSAPGVAVGGDVLTRFEAGQLQRLSQTTGRFETVTTPVFPLAPVSVVWSPDGQRALIQLPVTDGTTKTGWNRNDLSPDVFLSWWLVDADRSAPLPAGVTNPTWSADGAKILYVFVDPATSNAPPRLTIADPNGKNWQTLVDLTGLSVPYGLTPSPDGLRVAFTTTEGSSETSYVVGLSTKQRMTLAAGGGALKWAPDSSAVLLDKPNGSGIIVARIESQTQTNVTVAARTSQLTWESPTSMVGFAGQNLVRIDLAKQTQVTIRTVPTIDTTAIVLGVHDKQLQYLMSGTVSTTSLQP